MSNQDSTFKPTFDLNLFCHSTGKEGLDRLAPCSYVFLSPLICASARGASVGNYAEAQLEAVVGVRNPESSGWKAQKTDGFAAGGPSVLNVIVL